MLIKRASSLIFHRSRLHWNTLNLIPIQFYSSKSSSSKSSNKSIDKIIEESKSVLDSSSSSSSSIELFSNSINSAYETVSSSITQISKSFPTVIVWNNSEADEVAYTLVPLLSNHLNTTKPPSGEVSVYIKGFLGRGEKPEYFDLWAGAHHNLSVCCHDWDRLSYGYRWKNGELGFRIGLVPVPVVLISFTLYRLLSRAKLFTPSGLALAGLQEIGFLAGRMLFQYFEAKKTAKESSELLASSLSTLHSEYDSVRVVAHSLGCYHLVNALDHLPNSERPEEVHLCAPAVVESSLSPSQLAHLTTDSISGGHRAALYHTPRDLVLRAMFYMINGLDHALGAAGPQDISQYPGLEVIDVSTYFDTLVHSQYSLKFHEFALDFRDPVYQSQNQVSPPLLPSLSSTELSNNPQSMDIPSSKEDIEQWIEEGKRIASSQHEEKGDEVIRDLLDSIEKNNNKKNLT